jgi:hypothetical protein
MCVLPSEHSTHTNGSQKTNGSLIGIVPHQVVKPSIQQRYYNIHVWTTSHPGSPLDCQNWEFSAADPSCKSDCTIEPGVFRYRSPTNLTEPSQAWTQNFLANLCTWATGNSQEYTKHRIHQQLRQHCTAHIWSDRLSLLQYVQSLHCKPFIILTRRTGCLLSSPGAMTRGTPANKSAS